MTLLHAANQATLKEASEILEIPLGTIVSAIHRGLIPCHKEPIPPKCVRHKIVVDLTDVEAWDDTRTKVAVAEAVALFERGIAPAVAAERCGILRKSLHKALNRKGYSFR